MLKIIEDKISALNSELGYRLALWQHRKNLPVLEGRDRLILDTLKKEGVYVTTLTELGLPSNSKLLQNANSQLTTMLAADTNQNQNLPQISTVTDLPEFASWGSRKKTPQYH